MNEGSPLIQVGEAESVTKKSRVLASALKVLKKPAVKIGAGVLLAGSTAAFVGSLITWLNSGSTDPFVKFLSEQAILTDANNGNQVIPKSFYVTENFWEWVCEVSQQCSLDSPQSIDLQTERIDATVGQNIYDAATWQIALSLAGKFDIARHQTQFLLSGHTADANPKSTTQAKSDGSAGPDQTFTYGANQTYITDPSKAYFFRMLGPQYENPDPLNQTVTAEWNDWKPITGENAWANYIGPLQTAYLAHGRSHAAIPLESTEMQLAHQKLSAVEAMQAPIGCIYYTTTDVSANQGANIVNPYSVSTENNMSMLAGLNIYRTVLKAHAGQKFSDGILVNDELARVEKIITGILSFIEKYAYDKDSGYFYQGGIANDPSQKSNWVPTVQPFATDVQTWGITVLGQPWIDAKFGEGTTEQIWEHTKSNAGFYPNGDTSQSIEGVGFSNQPKPVTGNSFSVDVENLDGDASQNHPIRVFALFENSDPQQLSTAIPYQSTQNVTVPMHAGNNSPLVALQFLDENNIQVAQQPIYDNGQFVVNDQAHVAVSWANVDVNIMDYAGRHDIITGEWTYGAINMANAVCLQVGPAAKACEDAKTMSAGVQQLHVSNFKSSEVPASARVQLPSGMNAVEYANTRYVIPFGWIANPVPSTASTSWHVMMDKGFNPFSPEGNYAPNDFGPSSKKRAKPDEEEQPARSQDFRYGYTAHGMYAQPFVPPKLEGSSNASAAIGLSILLPLIVLPLAGYGLYRLCKYMFSDTTVEETSDLELGNDDKGTLPKGKRPRE